VLVRIYLLKSTNSSIGEYELGASSIGEVILLKNGSKVELYYLNQKELVRSLNCQWVS